MRGKEKVTVADNNCLSQLRRDVARQLRESVFIKDLRDYGTCGSTAASVSLGVTPIKNWLLAGIQAFPAVDKIANGDSRFPCSLAANESPSLFNSVSLSKIITAFGRDSR